MSNVLFRSVTQKVRTARQLGDKASAFPLSTHLLQGSWWKCYCCKFPKSHDPPRPAIGTIASEWSAVSKLNPLIAVNIDTTINELYGVQVLLSALKRNPVAQAQVNWALGVGKQNCWQVSGLLLQPLELPVVSEKKKNWIMCIIKEKNKSTFLKKKIQPVKC